MVFTFEAVDDPLKPETWNEEPGVCGSCIAWRPTLPQEGDEVATGACRLRPELGRVKATLKLCDLYKPRGQFVYLPSTSAEPSKKRRAGAARVLRRGSDGEMVPTERPRSPSVPRPPPPRNIDLGTDDGRLFRAILTEVLQSELGPAPRPVHPRFVGGKVAVHTADGAMSCTLPVERVFRIVDRLKTALEAIEEAVNARPTLEDQKADLVAQIRRMQGSMTTFNFLFAERGDYFSGKT